MRSSEETAESIRTRRQRRASAFRSSNQKPDWLGPYESLTNRATSARMPASAGTNACCSGGGVMSLGRVAHDESATSDSIPIRQRLRTESKPDKTHPKI